MPQSRARLPDTDADASGGQRAAVAEEEEPQEMDEEEGDQQIAAVAEDEQELAAVAISVSSWDSENSDQYDSGDEVHTSRVSQDQWRWRCTEKAVLLRIREYHFRQIWDYLADPIPARCEECGASDLQQCGICHAEQSCCENCDVCEITDLQISVLRHGEVLRYGWHVTMGLQICTVCKDKPATVEHVRALARAARFFADISTDAAPRQNEIIMRNRGRGE